jgi:MarC family membrane protein
MDHTFVSALVLLLLVLDPFGSLPLFVTTMSRVAPAQRVRVALRESLVAFGILVTFMFGGRAFLELMHLSERSLEVAGGVILLLIALRMIFATEGASQADSAPTAAEPFIVPIAVPMLAGPSALATVLLLVSRQPERISQWVAALAVGVAACGLVLVAADRIRRAIGDPMVSALEKLMGLVLSALAVEMILAGLKRYFFTG